MLATLLVVARRQLRVQTHDHVREAGVVEEDEVDQVTGEMLPQEERGIGSLVRDVRLQLRSIHRRQDQLDHLLLEDGTALLGLVVETQHRAHHVLAVRLLEDEAQQLRLRLQHFPRVGQETSQLELGGHGIQLPRVAQRRGVADDGEQLAATGDRDHLSRRLEAVYEVGQEFGELPVRPLALGVHLLLNLIQHQVRRQEGGVPVEDQLQHFVHVVQEWKEGQVGGGRQAVHLVKHRLQLISHSLVVGVRDDAVDQREACCPEALVLVSHVGTREHGFAHDLRGNQATRDSEL